MRTLPPALAASLASGVTTHCRCWLLTRRDGATLGITDHDRTLTIASQIFEAEGGFEASAAEAKDGLATSGGEITGALSSARILETDIEMGLYDGAVLRTYLVDWSAPALDFLIDATTFGEIKRIDGRFVAETRNAFHAYDQERGRVFAALCDAELGDARCGVSLAGAPFRLTGVIGTTDGRHRLIAPALETAPAGYFTRGLLRFTTGPNAGLDLLVKDHRADGEIVLWQRLVHEAAPGHIFTVTAGCDKRFATCRDRFANATNFRGFPFIPSPDFVITYARAGEGRHQGRPLVR